MGMVVSLLSWAVISKGVLAAFAIGYHGDAGPLNVGKGHY